MRLLRAFFASRCPVCFRRLLPDGPLCTGGEQRWVCRYSCSDDDPPTFAESRAWAAYQIARALRKAAV